METWPDAAYSPVPQRQGLDLGGRPAGAGHRDLAGHDRRRPGLRRDLLPDGPVRHLPDPGRRRRTRCPTDRYIDAVDQTSFLLDPDGVSNRKYLYYWLTNVFSALRVGEWKFMVASSSDDDRDCFNLGGFTGVTQKYSHGRLYNLYLDPKENHSYMIRKLAYIDSFTSGIARPLHDLRAVPAQAPHRGHE